jgi:hypothetical protein
MIKLTKKVPIVLRRKESGALPLWEYYLKAEGWIKEPKRYMKCKALKHKMREVHYDGFTDFSCDPCNFGFTRKRKV